MAKQIHVQKAAITDRIFAGFVSKDGKSWCLANRTDVTGEACAAVAQHVLAGGGTIEVTANGIPEYEITVKRIGAPLENGHE
ncbi:DUF7446 family protein [Xanthomonas citri]|uniref:DUF7446 family protein n=1 Tax=Xanthomonas citri TaxID=346 RepID=UPI0012FD7EFC|nr:hypothetical protein [Xanthomonas citri]